MTAVVDEIDREEALAELARLAEDLELFNPDLLYQAGRTDWPEEDRFQLQFHRSKAIIRGLFVGNGAGKTTVAGMECRYWVTHDHPFQPESVPDGPVQIVWLCPTYKQLELLTPQLEQRCFGTAARDYWNDNKHHWKWPDGSLVQVASADGDWAQLQGIEPDLIVVDEECPRRWWQELQMRRRAKDTRFVIAATATQGKRWCYTDVFVPWLKKMGVEERDEEGIRKAMRRQADPIIWCWPRGGIKDNPIAQDPEKGAARVEWYTQHVKYSSDAERLVRTAGGFHDFNSAPVFNLQALEDIEVWLAKDPAKGTDGILVPETDKAKKHPTRPTYKWQPTGGLYEGGRITIYKMPQPGRHYVLGADFALGLLTGDADAAIVCGVGDEGNLYQVAEAQGRWGGARFKYVLKSLGWFFNQALLVGERNNTGLEIMRWLFDDEGYTYQYMMDRDEYKVARKSDLLGYAKFHGSLVIPRLQWAIAPTNDAGQRLPPRVYLRSPFALEEMKRYEHKPLVKDADLASTPDKKLTMGAESGHHDDLVSALAGCITGWIELPKYIEKKARYKPGSAGDVLKHSEVTGKEKIERKSAFKRRLAR